MVQSLEDIKIFLEDCGHFEHAGINCCISTGSNGKQALIKLDTNNPRPLLQTSTVTVAYVSQILFQYTVTTLYNYDID